MLGTVLIWYAAGAIIAVMVGLDVRDRRRERPAGETRRGAIGPLLWVALGAAALIFLLWPWVALNMAQNVSL